MSKQRIPRLVRKVNSSSAGRNETEPTYEHWLRSLVRNGSAKGKSSNGWSVKLQHLGRRHTFLIATEDKECAAVQAKAIYETILAEGWDAALNSQAGQALDGLVKTDPAYWKKHLLLRRYRFPASGESEKSLAARIDHAGTGFFFPLVTEDADQAAAAACEIYCAIVRQGWEAACRIFPRELIVAFEWSADPILWTYTTIHTLVKNNAEVDTVFSSRQRDQRGVLIVEPDAGLRRALQWCINRQPGYCAIPCAAPEAFARAFAQHQPELVLFNRSLAERLGIAFAGGLARFQDRALALAYSVSVDGDHMFVSTPGGAEGYLLKRVRPTNVLDPMLASLNHVKTPPEDHLVPVKTFFKELLRPRTGKNTDALSTLTPRENEVLLLLSKGCVDKEIAQAMGISAWTVHGHIKKIFERLHVRTRTEAVVRFLEK
jgi:DNA-binding NarL/FixJ family response regulator